MDRAVAVCLLVALAGCAGFGVDSLPVGSSDGDALEPGTPGGAAGNWTAESVTGEALNATVVDVVDGDTVDVRYANGTTDTVRLLGIDTPEVRGENDPTEFEGVPDTDAGSACLREAGDAASSVLRERIADESVRVVVDDTADRRDQYGRLLAYVVHEGTDLNYWLVGAGHGRVYDTTFARSDDYYAAESTARDGGRGVWGCRAAESAASGDTATGDGLVVAEIHADAAGNDHENLDDEYVVFENAGESTLDIGGWTVSDEGGHEYTFPAGDELASGAQVTLHTGDGEDGEGERYWGSDGAVWNNGGDTVTVRTADGDLVLSRSYGG